MDVRSKIRLVSSEILKEQRINGANGYKYRSLSRSIKFSGAIKSIPYLTQRGIKARRKVSPRPQKFQRQKILSRNRAATFTHNCLAIRKQLTRNIETRSKLPVYYRTAVFPRGQSNSTCNAFTRLARYYNYGC